MAQTISEEAKKAIYEAVENTVDYAHKTKPDIILLGGAGAGHMFELFRLTWAKKYPNDKPPKYISLSHVPKPEVKPSPKTKTISFEARLEAFTKRFQDKFEEIKPNLKGKVLVFDEITISGLTMLSIHRALKNLKIPHTLVSVIEDSDYKRHKSNPYFKKLNIIFGKGYLPNSVEKEIYSVTVNPSKVRGTRESNYRNIAKIYKSQNRLQINSLKRYFRKRLK